MLMRWISSLMIWASLLALLSLLALALTYCVLRLQALCQQNQESKSLLEVMCDNYVGWASDDN